MSSTIGRVELEVGLNRRTLQNECANIGKTNGKCFSNMGAKLGNMFSVAFGNIIASVIQTTVQHMGEFITSSIELGSSIAELENVTSTVFPNMTSQVDVWSKDAINQFGLSELQAKKMIGTFGAMAQSFNYTEAEAYSMSSQLTALVGDTASFYNLNHEEAYTKLKAVFSGETESLKELGIVMTQTALDEYALANGFGKTTSSMSEQEKVALRLSFVTDKLSFAQGDFAKTSGQWANQTRILSGQWDAFKSALGQGFIAVLTPLIGSLNELMATVTRLGEKFRDFVYMVTGQDLSSGVGSVMTEISSVTSGAADSAENSANAAKGAAKAVQKSVLGFDQLNKLSPDSKGTSGSSSSTTTSSIPTVAPTTVDMTKAKFEFDDSTFLGSLIETIQSIDFSKVASAFDELKTSISPIIENIGDGLKWFYDEILLPIAAWTIEDVIPAFFNLLSGAFDVLNPLIEAAEEPLSWLWENFLSPIASWTGGVIVDTLNGIGDALSNIGNWMSENQELVDAFTWTVAGFFAAWKLTQLMAFIQMSGGVIGALSGITTALFISTAAKVKDKLETIALTAMYAKDFLVSVAKGTAALIKQGVQWVIMTGLKVKDKIATLAYSAAEAASTVVKGIATGVTTALGVAMTVLTSPITLIIAGIALLIAGIVLLIKNFDKVKEVATNVWNSIWGVIKTVINAILGGIEGMVNGVISGLNFMIGALNKLSFDVPDWVPLIGGKKFGFNITEIKKVQLPRLAEGGFVEANQPQLAMIGDNKTQGEIVTPEDKMYDIVSKALQAFMGQLIAALNASGGTQKQNETLQLIVQLGEDTIVNKIIKLINSESRRQGVAVISG